MLTGLPFRLLVRWWTSPTCCRAPTDDVLSPFFATGGWISGPTVTPLAEAPGHHRANPRANVVRMTTTRVALIRGINVGGKTRVPMAEMRSRLTAGGFRNVRTYIQSGNVVYDPPTGAKHSAAALRTEGKTIAAAIDAIAGFTPIVMVMKVDAIAAHLAASPYRDADSAKAFIVFADGNARELGDLGRYATNGEEWELINGVVHLHCPNGIGRSKLGTKTAASTKVPTTTRNLRTIAKLLELAE